MKMALFVALVVLASTLIAVVLVLGERPRTYELQWEQLGRFTYRSCDRATGNLIYKDLDGGFAGARFVVIEGGCR